MTCAKRVVICVLEDRQGRAVAFGRNDCANPQATCPRQPGEGYEKCKSICQQDGHAEIQALRSAVEQGADLRGGTAYIAGHERICDHCYTTLDRCGIDLIRITERIQ